MAVVAHHGDLAAAVVIAMCAAFGTWVTARATEAVSKHQSDARKHEADKAYESAKVEAEQQARAAIEIAQANANAQIEVAKQQAEAVRAIATALVSEPASREARPGPASTKTRLLDTLERIVPGQVHLPERTPVDIASPAE